MFGQVMSRRIIAVSCATVLIFAMSGLPSYADDESAAKTKAIAQAKDGVTQARKDLQAAEKRVNQAQVRVNEAQSSLWTAEAKYEAAKAISVAKAEELKKANKALAEAQAKEAENQAKVEAQRVEIAAYARAIVQDSLPLVNVVTLLGASNTSELANRLQWSDTVLMTNQVDLDVLKALQDDLAAASAEVKAAQVKAAEAQEAADLKTAEARAALDSAEAVHDVVLWALQEQEDAKAAAQQALQHNQAVLAAVESGQPIPSKPAATPTPQPSTPTTAAPANKTAQQKVVDFALSKVGGPYVYGGEGPKGYDCSGLTKMAYASVGIKLPHGSISQYSYGKPVAKKDLQPGDLVFYYSGPSHVAIYVGNGKVVHARDESIGIVKTAVDVAPYTGARRLL